MDTHIRYTIKKRYNENIPFKIDTGSIDKHMENTIIFEFDEYEEIYIKFDYDKNKGSIFIDTYNNESKIICSPNEYVCINLPRKENSLVPGYFEIEINYSYNIISYYKVEPKNIEWSELTNLREILDSYIKGICSNFNLNRSTYNYEDSNDILDYYRNQDVLWQEIKNSIKLLLTNPSGEYEKVYGYYNNPSKIDRRSIKGMNKNGIEALTGKHYTYKQNINFDTIDNNILYNKLLEYRNILKINISGIDNFYKSEYEQFNNLSEDLKNKLNELNSIKNNNILSDRYISSVENRVRYLKKIKYNKKEKLKIAQEIKNIINKIILELDDIIFEIQQKLNIDIYNYKIIGKVKKIRYMNIIEKLDNIMSIKNYYYSFNKKEETLTFRFKKTELLFEYLCFIRVIESILYMGFECQGGWFEKVINQEYDMEIPSECENLFVKDGIKIIVYYDKEAPNKTEENYEGLYSFNSRHRRPDISILIYKDNKFIKALILEVKCRNSKYIYSNQGDTYVIDTMKDYSQLCYYNNKIKRDAVDKVIVLYPKQRNNIDLEKNELIDLFSFIPITINSDNLDSELHEEIEKFIKSYTE